MLLDLVISEATKTITASLASGGIAGIGRLARLLRGAAGEVPADPAAAVDALVARGRDDPRWVAEVAAALAGRLDADRAAVPPPPSPFWDRESLCRAVPDAGVVVFGGQRGCGKTALVGKLAADLVDRESIGVGWVDLDEFRDGDVPRLAEAKRYVLGQLGVTDVSAAEPELAQQYLRAPLHRRFVLVVENVLGAAEARALAPGWPASLVLVTTRRLTDDLRAAYPGAVELDGLDDDGAWRMLAARCPAELLAGEQRAARELLQRFGKLPYAIEQLGVLLSRRAGEPGPVARVAAAFDAAGITETSALIADGLARTVDLLPERVFADFLELAEHPGGEFTAAGADALLGHPSARSIDALHDVGLLTSPVPGRHRLHWFARRLARELAQRRGVDTGPAFDRALGYFVGWGLAADLAGGDRLRRHPVAGAPDWPSDVDRIDWFDAEREVLADLVERAFRAGRYEEVCQLCGVLEVVLLNRGRYELCLAAFERGAAAAAHLTRPGLLARMHGLCCRANTLLHHFDRASAALAAAWSALPAGDDQQESSLWELRGRLHEERADHPAAVEAFTLAVEIDRRIGDGRALGLHARMLANVLVKAGRPGPAMPLLAEAAANTDDDRNASRVCAVWAKALVELGDFGPAAAQLDDAKRLAAIANAGQYGYELADIEAELAFRTGDVGAARSRWGWLAQEHLNAGHPRSAEYLAKLNRLPPPPR